MGEEMKRETKRTLNLILAVGLLISLEGASKLQFYTDVYA
jgi:hypothetical protein